MRALVSGGGTAGHVYPSLTVAAQLRDEEHDEVAFVGTSAGLEARLAPEAGLDFFTVEAHGFDRSDVRTLVKAAWVTAASLVRCLGLLRAWKPDVVIGFGGYVSLPLGLAAGLSGVPLVLHEQNAVPGLANRVLSRWAGAVCVTYPESAARLAHPQRAVVTGNPVRAEIALADRQRGRKALRLAAKDTVLLVFGGSRGARHLNQAMISLHARLSSVKNLKVVHVTGPLEIQAVSAALAAAAGGKAPSWWRVHDYLTGMADALAAADLVVCRAGATTLAELAVVGRPAVLVPYPFATDDHQTKNARALVEEGAAVLVPDGELDSPTFAEEVLRLLEDASARERMAQAAASLGRPLAARAVGEVACEQAARARVRRGRGPDADEAGEAGS